MMNQCIVSFALPKNFSKNIMKGKQMKVKIWTFSSLDKIFNLIFQLFLNQGSIEKTKLFYQSFRRTSLVLLKHLTSLYSLIWVEIETLIWISFIMLEKQRYILLWVPRQKDHLRWLIWFWWIKQLIFR